MAPYNKKADKKIDKLFHIFFKYLLKNFGKNSLRIFNYLHY